MGKTAATREGHQVLVVDDDATGRLIAREALEADGIEVIEASEGNRALELFTEASPDLVLLDVRMPGIDGFEVCRRCRMQPGAAWTPIVMVTSMDDMASIQRAYEVGATDFITKPINWLILKQRIHYLLRSGDLVGGLRDSEERLGAAERIARLGSWRLHLDREVVIGSEQFSKILGLPVFGKPLPMRAIESLVHSEDRGAREAATDACISDGTPLALDHRMLVGGGRQIVVRTLAERVCDTNGRPVYLEGTMQDITEQRHAENQIRFLAYHDGLTKVGNRVLFNERLEAALAHARRGNYAVGVLFLDLDHFKRINDTMGHVAGDEVLRTVAKRLVECVRETDLIARSDPESAISRLGGDEFTILLTEFGDVRNLAKIARRILSNLSRPIAVANQEVVIGASIGISAFPVDGEDADTLIRNADAAMYHSKEQGRNNFQFYTPAMNEAAASRMLVEGKLRRAVERGEITVHYQPKVSLATGRLMGLEALARWKDEELGAVSPAVFIPIAEEAGLIAALGEGVLRESCRQLKDWRTRGLPTVPVAVNFSVHQFRDEDFAIRFDRILAEFEITPDLIDCEITESTLMDDGGTVSRNLAAMRERCVRVALDDFGTGYSSLSYLRKLPFDILKIDRAFVAEIADAQTDAALTAAIIAMGKALGLRTVAEGVETETQRELLAAWGCDEIQGYLLSPPAPPDELERCWLQSD